MSNSQEPVIVFHGENEFEAQAARDILTEASIPVLHIPSLSTGVFGMQQNTRVAVPEKYVEQALAALQEAGLTGRVEPRKRGLASFQETMQNTFPIAPLPSHTRMTRILIGMGVVILALVVLVLATR